MPWPAHCSTTSTTCTRDPPQASTRVPTTVSHGRSPLGLTPAPRHALPLHASAQHGAAPPLPYPLPLGCKRSPHGSPQRPPVPQSEGVYGGWRNTYSVGCSADGQTVLVLEFRQNGYDTNPYHGSGMPNHEVLWKSTDGAATFTDANSALHSVGMHALSMSNSGAAFVVGFGDNNHLLYKSSDLFATYEVKPARRHIPASSPISRLSHLIHSPLSSPTDCGDWRRHSHFCKCQEV